MSENKKKSVLNKTLMVLSALLVLAVILVPIIDKNFKSSLLPELTDFAVDKPDDVDRIYMKTKDGPNSFVDLKKQADGTWTVNDSFQAADGKVRLLLYEYMARLKMKNPIPKEGVENVKRDMIANATKVVIYKKGKMYKTYYVGSNTADELATFMYLEGSAVPFAVHIPGFMGYLNVVYNANPKAWKSTKIFQTDIKQIQKVTLNYFAEPEHSFQISKAENRFEIHSLTKNITKTTEPNLGFVKQYVATFENLTYEGALEGGAKRFADSIIKYSQPYAEFQVGNTNKKTTSLKLYLKPVTKETKAQYDENGQELPYDLDRFYGVSDAAPGEVLSVQSFVFKNVLKHYSDFYQ